MGKIINTTGYLLPSNKLWNSTWYSNKNYYSNSIFKDIHTQEYIKRKILLNNKQQLFSKIKIERTLHDVNVYITSYNNNYFQHRRKYRLYTFYKKYYNLKKKLYQKHIKSKQLMKISKYLNKNILKFKLYAKTFKYKKSIQTYTNYLKTRLYSWTKLQKSLNYNLSISRFVTVIENNNILSNINKKQLFFKFRKKEQFRNKKFKNGLYIKNLKLSRTIINKIYSPLIQKKLCKIENNQFKNIRLGIKFNTIESINQDHIHKLYKIKNKFKKKLSKKIKNYLKENINLYLYSTNKFDATMIATVIGSQIERRIRFGIILKNLKRNFQRYKNIHGLRIECSGRPFGNNIAFVKWFQIGKIPLHSFNYNIQYAHKTLQTRYGTCGIKVWINHSK